MSTYKSKNAIATTEQYKQALLRVRDKNLPTSHLLMLQAQGRSPGGKITATRLAEVAGFHNYNAANLHYGTLAKNVAEHIGFDPEKRADGSGMWWSTLSYCEAGGGEPDTGHFEFIMRPELVQALQEMRWA